jgi:hypothetical protein
MNTLYTRFAPVFAVIILLGTTACIATEFPTNSEEQAASEANDSRQQNVRVLLPEPVTLKHVTDHLPENVLIRGLVVLFEPGRTGTLALATPSQSADDIAERHVAAQKKIHDELRNLLSVDSRGMTSPAAESRRIHREQEIEKLDEMEESPLTAEKLMILQVHVDGPLIEIQQLARTLGGQIDD